MTTIKLHKADWPRAQAYYDDLGVPVRFEHDERCRWGITSWGKVQQPTNRYQELDR